MTNMKDSKDDNIYKKKDPEGSFIEWFILLPTQQTVFQGQLNLASIHIVE